MNNSKLITTWFVTSAVAAMALFAAGCKSTSEKPAATAPVANKTEAAPMTNKTVTATATATAKVEAAKPEQTAPQPIRIKTAATAPFTDSSGNVWMADKGFADGDTIERPDVPIENTKDPAIYQSERYSMTAFSMPVPNGKYTVKLHFAETYEDISGPGQRVFSFNVEGQEFKDFDIFAKAGGARKAYVETVPVEVTDGKVDITFKANIENPAITGIEILPGS